MKPTLTATKAIFVIVVISVAVTLICYVSITARNSDGHVNPVLHSKFATATLRPQRLDAAPFIYSGLQKVFPYTDNRVLGSGKIKEIMTHYDPVMDPVLLCPRDRMIVPNIVHWIWIYHNPKTMLFHHYVSALSAVRIQKPDRFFLWHNTRPTGQYWDMLVTEARSSGIEMVYKKTELPEKVFDQTLSGLEHKTDVQRLTAITTFGGIYMDSDVIILKPLDPLFCYNVTLGLDTDRALFNGIIVAAPDAQFLHDWYDEYRTYKPNVWNYNSVQVPFKLWQRNPDLIHVEHTTMNLPNWKETKYIYNAAVRYDWSHNYCVHTWYRFHKEEYNHTSIMSVESTLGDMFRYVLAHEPPNKQAKRPLM